MFYGQRPDTALKRAEEFEGVGKPLMALELLHEVISMRKYRTWSKTHEEILIKYIDLCIDLKRSADAKDGLHQYKLITGQTAVSSLETVIKHYLQSVEARVEQAHDKVNSMVQEMDDLEASETPESILLAAVSDEGNKDRQNRVLFTPWFRFLWDAYRHVLDNVKNNSKLEHLYQDTASRAFKFCAKYSRKNEFRRLCDLLQKHFHSVQKYPNQTNIISYANPESLRRALETRFELVSTAADMGLWQECYKGIEDIAILMDMSVAATKKSPKPQLLAVYYQKLASVFWRSEDYAFHACAWQKLFQISKEQKKNFPAAEAQAMASCVLLATLSVPLKPVNNEAKKVQMEYSDSNLVSARDRNLTTLLRLHAVPDRANLVADMLVLNIMNYVPEELKLLYTYLEEEFHPLQLTKKMTPVFEYIEKNEKLSHYLQPLRDVVFMRLLKQLSQLYSSLHISRLATLLPFFNEFEIEQFVVQSVKARLVDVRLDHRSRALTFGANLFVSQSDDVNEGPRLQTLQSDMVRSQLTTLSKRLNKAVNMIAPEQQQADRQSRRNALLQDIQNKINRERYANMQRRSIVEKRVEDIEKEHLNKQREEQQRKAEEKRRREEAEAKRKLEEEERRKAKAQEEIARKVAEEAKKALGVPIDEDVTDLEEVRDRQIAALKKEKRELQNKLKTQFQQIDFFERAKRVVEIPKLKAQFEEQKVKDRALWETKRHEREAKSKEQHADNLKIKARLQRILPHRSNFLKLVTERREAEFKQQSQQYQMRMEEQKERKEREEQEAREREEAVRAEEERIRAERAAEEERRRKEEEERERKAAEEAKRKAQEEADRQKRLDAAAAKQRQKEAEIEARLEQEKQSLKEKDGWRTKDAPAWRPGRGAGSSWRDKQSQPGNTGSWRGRGRDGPSSGAYRPPRARDGDGPPGGAYRPPRGDGGRGRGDQDRDRDRDRGRDRDRDRNEDRQRSRDRSRGSRDDSSERHSRRRRDEDSRSHRRRASVSPPSSRRRGDRQYDDEKPRAPPSEVLGIFGMHPHTEKDDILDLFEPFGRVERVTIIYDRETGNSRGFGFVTFDDLEDAKEAREATNGSMLLNRKVRVDYSKTQRPHSPTPGVYMGERIPARRSRGGDSYRDRDRDRRYGGGYSSRQRSDSRYDDDRYSRRSNRRSPSPRRDWSPR
eukprot:m.69177 g.69177  ORF g.69177 m.69177 type:complete len:1174 (-) comp19963_c2_seq1:181-3702(-)